MSEVIDRSPTNAEIAELRKGIKEWVEKRPEDRPGLEFDARDVDRIMTDDRYVSRFFRHCLLMLKGDTLSHTEKMILRVLNWRKAQGVNDIKSSDLTEKVKNAGSLFLRNRDVDGNRLMVSDVKKHIKNDAELPDLQKLFIYYLELVDREDNDGQVTYVFDCAGAGYQNLDLEFVVFANRVLGAMYPLIVNNILVLDLPWLFKATWKIVKAWLPAKGIEKIHFVDRKSMDQFISKDQQFVAWGGKDDWVYEFIE